MEAVEREPVTGVAGECAAGAAGALAPVAAGELVCDRATTVLWTPPPAGGDMSMISAASAGDTDGLARADRAVGAAAALACGICSSGGA